MSEPLQMLLRIENQLSISDVAMAVVEINWKQQPISLMPLLNNLLILTIILNQEASIEPNHLNNTNLKVFVGTVQCVSQMGTYF